MSTLYSSYHSSSSGSSQQKQQEAVQFTTWQQNAAVAIYIISDTVLRFCYQSVIGKSSRQEQADDADIESYDKPMFMTWICYSMFSIYLIVALFLLRFRHSKSNDVNANYTSTSSTRSISEYYSQEWSGALGCNRAVIWCAGAALFLWSQNYLYVSGLRYIHVSLSTAVGQAEAPFTVGLTVIVLSRIFSFNEKKGILLCFTGITIIVLLSYVRAKKMEEEYGPDEDNDEDYDDVTKLFFGIVSTLAAAFSYAVYQIFWQAFDDRRFPTDDESHKQPSTPVDSLLDTFFTISIVGVLSFSLGWIVIIFSHYTGLETFEYLPSSLITPILITSTLSAFVDATNGVACVVSSAMIVALCYPLSIPLSVIIERVWDGIPFSSWGFGGLIGTILVLSGIFFLEKDEVEVHIESSGSYLSLVMTGSSM